MMHIKLHKTLLVLPLLASLVACSDQDLEENHAPLGEEKTPLSVTAVLDANGQVSKTRAADKAFANGDQMVAYFRHVKWDGTVSKAENNDYTVTSGNRDTKDGDDNPLISKLVTFTAGTNTVPESQILDDAFPFKDGVPVVVNKDNSTLTALTAAPKLYWDDFSVSTVDGKQDLRTEGHYLQSYYGYCYNGSPADNETGTHITSQLVESTGVLGWKVATDQSGTTGTTEFQKSDLLWSAEQLPVRYNHATGKGENHGQIVIPFLHAMSKVTIKVTVDGTFTATDPFASTTVTLNDVRTTCTATAPSATLDFTGATNGNVKMQPGTVSDKTKSFQAIIVPSVLTVGNTFATITNMDGNTYSIPITDAIVQNDLNSGWGSQLTPADEDVNNGTAQSRPMTRADEGRIPSGKGHQMKSGVHYILNVTVSKASVSVSATILDWDEIEAEGVGQIYFENDVPDNGTGTIQQELQVNGFDVYKAVYTKDSEGHEVTPTFGTRATHLRYLTSSQTWKYDPVIYWQGGVAEYFRALSNVKADAEGTPENESLEMENGRDALWGTTAEADGYTEGQAVNPRTGKVPLKFYHAMSKITFKLKDEAYTADKAAANDPSLLNLENATIQLTNLATGGKLDLFTDTISGTEGHKADKIFSEDPGAVPSRMGYFAAEINGTATTNKADVTLKDYVITPQTIGDDAQVIITLADGTVYKAQLNKCKYDTVQDGVPSQPEMTQWHGGMHYIYTIKLSKETITFRAEVKNWEEKSGSGNATLEWD